MLPVTLMAMLVLLMIQLQRSSRMLLALLMAPFGLIGIVLAGMIIRNAVILISEADNNVREGIAYDAAIIAAAGHRARPLVLTACAAIIGMLPISEQVFWGPMAYAIIGGLLVATLMTLTVLPAAMSLVMQKERP